MAILASLPYGDWAYPAGFPHSEIHGSKAAFAYPWLFADRCVLLRQLVPGHPPCALIRLISQATLKSQSALQPLFSQAPFVNGNVL